MSMHACNKYCEMDDCFHFLQRDFQYDAFEQDDSEEWFEELICRLEKQREDIDRFLELLQKEKTNE